MSASVLFIDNYDSFVFNSVDELARRGCRVEVYRNDIEPSEALSRLLAMPAPRLLVLSPGPGTPAQAGSCIELARRAQGRVPVFGICLGHQVLVEALGGEVGPAGEVVHGKADAVEHDGSGLFRGIPSPMTVGRYHSLAARVVPSELVVTARTGDLVMAVQHRSLPMAGVQFHPESILSPGGGALMDNVLAWADGPGTRPATDPGGASPG